MTTLIKEINEIIETIRDSYWFDRNPYPPNVRHPRSDTAFKSSYKSDKVFNYMLLQLNKKLREWLRSYDDNFVSFNNEALKSIPDSNITHMAKIENGYFLLLTLFQKDNEGKNKGYFDVPIHLSIKQ